MENIKHPYFNWYLWLLDSPANAGRASREQLLCYSIAATESTLKHVGKQGVVVMTFRGVSRCRAHVGGGYRDDGGGSELCHCGCGSESEDELVKRVHEYGGHLRGCVSGYG